MKATGTKRTTTTVEHELTLSAEDLIAAIRAQLAIVPEDVFLRIDDGCESIELGRNYAAVQVRVRWSEVSHQEAPLVVEPQTPEAFLETLLPRRPLAKAKGPPLDASGVPARPGVFPVDQRERDDSKDPR